MLLAHSRKAVEEHCWCMSTKWFEHCWCAGTGQKGRQQQRDSNSEAAAAGQHSKAATAKQQQRGNSHKGRKEGSRERFSGGKVGGRVIRVGRCYMGSVREKRERGDAVSDMFLLFN